MTWQRYPNDLGSLKDFRGLKGVTDAIARAKLRAELDGLVAHLYGLTEAELVHILGTFPLVEQSVKDTVIQAYRDVKRGLVK